MNLSTRLTAGAVAIVVTTAVVFVVGASSWLRRDLEMEFAAELEREVRLIAEGLTAEPIQDLDSTADRLGEELGRRVTLMAEDGTVLGDSDFDGASLALLENHLDRPEVQVALAGGIGFHRRVSASTNRAELKVAIARWPGIVRVSAPVDQVQDILGRVTQMILLAALVAIAVGSVLAVFAGRGVARPLRELAGAASTVGGWGRAKVFPQSSITEIKELVRAFRAADDDLKLRVSELRREREESATLIESMVEGVIAADRRGTVTLCNQAMRELLGLGPEDAVPNLAALFHQRDARDVVEEVQKGEVVAGREVDLNGRTILLTARPLPAGGAVMGLLDISDVRKVQLIRRDFVANVSHELKTPLTSILGYAETLLANDLDDATRRNFLRVIHDNGRRMQRLVDDLLDLARLESGAFTPRREEIDLETVANESWAAFAARVRERGIAFRVEPGAPWVLADREALLHILTNLLDNASRHTSAGDTITVSGRVVDDQVEIAVADTGSGIAAEHVPRVFERFYRVDPGRSRQEGGTGLGLAIVKHLGEAHGGQVDLESALGVGTTVRVRFPCTTSSVPT